MDEEVKKYKIFKNIAAREYYGAAEPPVRCGESHLSLNRINQLNIELSKIGRTEDILKAVVKNHKRQENYYFLLPLAIRAGYHFSNHAVKSPINIGIRLFTRISTFPNPAFLNRKVQIAVSTYSVPHAAARI